MKICNACTFPKEDDEFYYNQRTEGGPRYLFSKCKLCYNAERKVKYRADPTAPRKSARESWRRRTGYYRPDRKARIKDRVEYIQTVKREGRCADCDGQFHPVAMDFDHRGDKTAGVAYMAQHGYSLDAIKEEIAKCDLVCANCHRLRTWVNKSTGHLARRAA